MEAHIKIAIEAIGKHVHEKGYRGQFQVAGSSVHNNIDKCLFDVLQNEGEKGFGSNTKPLRIHHLFNSGKSAERETTWLNFEFISGPLGRPELKSISLQKITPKHRISLTIVNKPGDIPSAERVRELINSDHGRKRLSRGI